MNALFWTFCTLLITLTLISAFGGGIRYRENFLEEVFDRERSTTNNTHATSVANDLLEKLTFDQMAPVMGGVVEDEMAAPLSSVESEDAVEMPKAVAPMMPTMPTQESSLSPAPTLVEAFDGEVFARFQ